ncbi:uncharacterized protein RHIMIDRAFT_275260 [Rhizopus microsporus ATCC 52813]|uniref:Invertebrate defensins family profile domain-containing protein n=1 Tax=Rhizopus microsporus ATCC 52813 TaxID=1340429 RepID=A0A2G4T0F5_RHIZD|nr:uncharacterized protein RHIMIDRAFT_275260 [Rhizopus microsporus ATCC 52813]PHZ14499.1 hypothetical protein RHIMIDRAFT_275260 [Rhizopus microsporus ATCC 52813]
MSLTLYLALLFVAMIMVTSAAPSNKACHRLAEPHANAVCKSHCDNAGYLLGECGRDGICLCRTKYKK